MSGGDDQGMNGRRSVRVEVDAFAASDVSAPAPSRRRRSRSIVATVFVFVVLIGAMLAFARLSTRVGEPQDAGSIVPEPADRVDSPAPDAVTVVEAGPLAEFVPTNLDGNIQAVVPAESGWLAVHWTSSRRTPPRIEWSDDAVTWRELDTVFEIGELDGAGRSFSHLTTTDSGFAMLMVEVREKSDGGQVLQVHRLTSTDGRVWGLDPRFSSLVVNLERFGGLHHAGKWVQATTTDGSESTGPELARWLLDTAFVEPPPIDTVCWTFDLEGRVHLVGCDGDTVAELEPEQLREPDRYDDVAACLAELDEPVARERTISVTGVGTDERTVEGVSSLVGVWTTRSGTLVVLDAGRSEPTGERSCAAVLDVPEPASADPSLLIWPADLDAPVRLELPAADVPLTGGLRDVVERADGSLRLLVGSSVWEVRRGRESVRLLAAVSTDTSGGQIIDARHYPSLVFDETGDRVVVVADGRLSVIEVVTGVETELGRLGDGREWPQLLAVADDLVLVRSGGGVRLISLDQSGTDGG